MILNFRGGPKDGMSKSITGILPMQFRFPKSGFLAHDPQKYVGLVDVYYLQLIAFEEDGKKNYDFYGQFEGI